MRRRIRCTVGTHDAGGVESGRFRRSRNRRMASIGLGEGRRNLGRFLDVLQQVGVGGTCCSCAAARSRGVGAAVIPPDPPLKLTLLTVVLWTTVSL